MRPQSVIEESDFFAFDLPSYVEDLILDSDASSGDEDVEVPAKDYADFQKKQQRRKSSVKSQSGSRQGSFLVAPGSRQGSFLVAPGSRRPSERRRSSSIVAYNATRRPSNTSTNNGRGSLVVEGQGGQGGGARPKGISFAAPSISEDQEDEAKDSPSESVVQSEHVTTLPVILIPKTKPLPHSKSKKFLISAKSIQIIEKPNTTVQQKESTPSMHTSVENHNLPTSTSARLLPRAESMKHDGFDEFKESNIKRALTGVLPMGYMELKQLSEQVSNLTHKLRMHHNESVDDSEKLILDDVELTQSLEQPLGQLPMSIDALSPATPNYEQNMAKIENIVFPGINSCDIPGKLDITETLRSHCSAKLDDVIKPHILKSWLTSLKSKLIVKLVQLLFWYSWHELFNPFEFDTIELLFKKISSDYVGLFVSVNVPKKDLFFVKLPDFLSFVVVRVFQDAFPESTDLLETSFKSDICTKICVLLSGICPSFLPSESWESLSEPVYVKATKTEDAKEQKRRALTQILTSAKCLDDPVSLDEKVIDKEFVIVVAKPASSYFGDTRKGHSGSFNLYQNSPLVTQYLQTARHKQVKIKRTEISKGDTPSHLKTYRDILDESKKQSRERKEEYRRNQERIQRENRSALIT